MNRLPIEKRAQILQLLVEGNSMRSVERIVGCSINTVTKTLEEAGQACQAYQDAVIRNIKAKQAAFFRIDVASTIFMLPAEPVVPGSIGQPLQAPSYG